MAVSLKLLNSALGHDLFVAATPTDIVKTFISGLTFLHRNRLLFDPWSLRICGLGLFSKPNSEPAKVQIYSSIDCHLADHIFQRIIKLRMKMHRSWRIMMKAVRAPMKASRTTRATHQVSSGDAARPRSLMKVVCRASTALQPQSRLLVALPLLVLRLQPRTKRERLPRKLET